MYCGSFLQSTPLLIILFFFLQTLQVAVFILLLISVIFLLILFLGFLLLIKILCSCVLLTSNISFVHVLQYEISSSLVSNSLYSCLVSLAHFQNPLFTTVTENPFLPIIHMLITSKTCVVFTVLTYKILVSIVVIFILLFAYQCST